METVKYDIGSKRKAAALDGVKKSKTFLSGKPADSMLASCGSNKALCADVLKQMDEGMGPLSDSLKASMDAFTGSEQERTALDKAYASQESLSKLLTTLQESMIPTDYITPVPDEYSDLPQLQKRATIEMVLKKSDAGEPFRINGDNFPEAKLTMVIDGYTGMYFSVLIVFMIAYLFHTQTEKILIAPFYLDFK